MENINILIVEDKKSVAEYVETRLKELEYTVCAVVPTGAQAVEKAAEIHPDVVLIGIELEGEINGIEAAERIRNCLDIPTIYLVNYPQDVFLRKEDLLKRAEITNPFEYIPRPYEKRRLCLNIESAVYQHKMEANTQHLTKILNGISDAAIATDNKGSTLLDTAPETLNEDVVKIAASAVPTDGNVSRLKPIGKRIRSKLTALVTVEYQRSRLAKCAFESRQTKVYV